MNIIFKVIILCLIASQTFSQEITVINLHELQTDSNSEVNGNILNTEENIEEINLEETELIIESTDESNEEDSNLILESQDNESNEETIFNDTTSNLNILTVPDYWENSDKKQIEFLFQQVNSTSSKVLNNYFIESLISLSKPPKSYNQSEFDNLRIQTLLIMEQKDKALKAIQDIDTYDDYKDYYNGLILDYYLTTNNLTEACNFKDSFSDDQKDPNNFILKLNIFCSFLENKTEEADFFNSLLLDLDDNDELFQQIYFYLKNDENKISNLSQKKYNKSSFSLYSAMIRIGNLPFTENFLEFDSINLSLPIVLSSSTEIALRLKSAHKAYEYDLLNADSLTALYQSVDFTKKELSNWEETLKNFTKKTEMGMALLFQNIRIQLLSITKLESLKEFWNYAKKHNLEKLAYDVSKNLFENIEPSVELSDYSLLIAKAHVFNKNYDLATKWISFAESYVSQTEEFNEEDLNNIKFLYDLYKSEDKITFIKVLENDFTNLIKRKEISPAYSDILKTIFLINFDNKEIINVIKTEKKVFDERIMPSQFIINLINLSSENKRVGELLLTSLVSLGEKSWSEIHPQHLTILLKAFKKAELENLLRDLIIEILENSKLI